jgi:hypothetical protein
MTLAMTPGIRCWEPSATVVSVAGVHPAIAVCVSFYFILM